MKNTFNKYKIINKAINRQLVDFCFSYFKLKIEAVHFMYKHRLQNQSELLGNWNDPQVPNTFSCYGDFVMETLLLKMIPIMKKQTGLDLIPTYSYARMYKKGDILKRHKDRSSCEISTTLNLGGDNWPIYLEPSGKVNKKGIEINLKPGDMLIYSGCELEHWRKPFKGKMCAQAFLHYNNSKGLIGDKNKFDGRPLLGLPSNIKKII